MTGCPVGAVQGWVGQEVSVVEYSQQYPKASTHIENSHLLLMSTHLKFLGVHTPVGQENALDFNTNQLVIPLFISVLKKHGGWGGAWIASLSHSLPRHTSFHFSLNEKERQKSPLLPLCPQKSMITKSDSKTLVFSDC